MSPRILVLLTALVCTWANAEPEYVLSVQADRPDALYQKGETVTFTISLSLDKMPVPDATVNWTLSKDGVPPMTNGKVLLTGTEATVTGKLAEPGFLQCRASFARPDKVPCFALGGAAIDPLQIKPSLPVPADFDDFWTGQKKKLAAIPVNAQLRAEKPLIPGVDGFEVTADCDGPPVSGYYARPAGAQPKSLPIILTVHGAGVRSSNLAAAAGWAKQGFLAMDINAHGLPNGKPEAFYKALSDGELKGYPALGHTSRDTVYFRGMFLRLIRALDFLTAQPEWDGRCLVVHGTSQGGYQAIVAAGLEPRVTFFAAGVPAGCDHTGGAAGRVNGWPHFLARPPAQPDPAALEAVRYYDAMNFATRTQASGILTVGFIDTTCPPTSVYAAYNALPGKKQIYNDIPCGHASSPPAGAAMRQAILAHVEAMKKDFSKQSP